MKRSTADTFCVEFGLEELLDIARGISRSLEPAVNGEYEWPAEDLVGIELFVTACERHPRLSAALAASQEQPRGSQREPKGLGWMGSLVALRALPQ